MSCDLCGAGGRVFYAMLREAFSNALVQVRACNPCGERAWRTTGQPYLAAPLALPAPKPAPKDSK